MKGVLFDIDGVIYNAGEPIPGAAEAISQMRAWGVACRFLTNTSSLSRVDLAARLVRFGVPTAPDEILHPPSAAATWLRERSPQGVALFLPPSAAQEFEGLPLLPADAEEGADVVVIGDLQQGWTFATLNLAFRLLHANPQATLVALGMSKYWHAPDGLQLDVGPIATALAMAADREPEVLGKPASPFFEQALAALGLPAEEVVMVGDDVAGDVGGAQGAGMRGLLVRTGKFREGDLDQGITPDGVLDSVADLPAWWEQQIEEK